MSVSLFGDTSSYGGGGGIYCEKSSLNICNNIINSNTSDYGDGIYCYDCWAGIGLNIFVNITDGIYCWDCSAEIHWNNIFGIHSLGFYLDATNNWWGSPEREYIENIISGKVLYEPYLSSATPIRISSLELKSDNTYSINSSEDLFIGDTLYIEILGMDGDSTSIDNTNVIVKSTSDTVGISVKLNETDINTGAYRGVAFIKNSSNDEIDIICASSGDFIKVFSVVDTSIYNSVLISKPTSVKLISEKIPNEYRLFQNFPNPFNTETKIKYEIPKTSNVEITIYNVMGQKVKTLLNKIQNPGFYEIVWNGTNDIGFNVSSGVYLYIIKTKDFFASKKMVLLR